MKTFHIIHSFILTQYRQSIEQIVSIVQQCVSPTENKTRMTL